MVNLHICFNYILSYLIHSMKLDKLIDVHMFHVYAEKKIPNAANELATNLKIIAISNSMIKNKYFESKLMGGDDDGILLDLKFLYRWIVHPSTQYVTWISIFIIWQHQIAFGCFSCSQNAETSRKWTRQRRWEYPFSWTTILRSKSINCRFQRNCTRQKLSSFGRNMGNECRRRSNNLHITTNVCLCQDVLTVCRFIAKETFVTQCSISCSNLII